METTEIRNINEIKAEIKNTEIQINELTNSIKDMQDEKNRITEEYESKKEDFESYRTECAYQSTFGTYFLIIAAIAFVVILFKYWGNSIDSFFLIPGTALLAAGITGKVLGAKKFNEMAVNLKKKEKDYKSVKTEYEAFMKQYNSTESELEKQQLKWELVENDMIEARKDAWIREQRKLKANA